MPTREEYAEIDTVSVFVDMIMPQIQQSIAISMSALDPKLPGNLLALQIAADYAVAAWIKDQKLRAVEPALCNIPGCCVVHSRRDTPENLDGLTNFSPTH